MTRKRTLKALSWQGPATIRAARRAMTNAQRIEIMLPLNMHHALYVHLHPGAAPGTPEDFDAAGGAELLPRIASVAGLEPLADLADSVARSRYRVALTSPNPLLTLSPPAAAGART